MTWLPIADFEESTRVLDRQRLGKQRVEAMQILNALRKGGGWANHPATVMWRGYEGLLVLYGLQCCSEWRKRGYRDTLYDWFKAQYTPGLLLNAPVPPWYGNEAIHGSHRGRLLAKKPRVLSAVPVGGRPSRSRIICPRYPLGE
jgi:hypothetical protein